ncbi:UDP-glucosyltransferase 2-like [Aphomia sociella]
MSTKCQQSIAYPFKITYLLMVAEAAPHGPTTKIMEKLAWLIFTIPILNLCGADKILVIFPLPARSHNILAEGIVKHLLNADHEVTLITPYPKTKPHKNLHVIDVSANAEIMDVSIMNMTTFLNNENPFGPTKMFEFTNLLFENTIKNPNVLQLLSDVKKKFDVVIAEYIFNDVYSGIATIFDCPFIWVSSIEPHSVILSLIDEATNPAYVPDSQSSTTPPFSFLERVSGLYVQLMGVAFKQLYTNDHSKKMFEKFIGPFITKRGKVIPSFDEVNYNVSLILGNSHVSLGQATRLPQNYIPIAGFHIDLDVKPLPDDVQKLLDDAKDGLIYFSMGSNLKSKDLPDELKKGFLKLFSELKQMVLWKFEEVLPDLPKNVHIVQWAPQHGILAHPNCILFITHGGLLSTTETVHFGKPIIGIPVFGDQFTNIGRAVKRGFARKVTFSYNVVDDLKVAIKEVLGNPTYTNKVKELSQIYHDRPVSPGKELVHWVEHVVKTRGAPHLCSPALYVPFYRKCYLDLLALIVTVIIALVVILKRALKSKKKQDFKKKNK